MKKIISTSVALVVIGGLAFSAYNYSAKEKSFEKNKSYNTDNIESLKVDSDSWEVSFKKSDSNELTISAEGKQIDDNPVTFMREGEALVIKQNEQEQNGFLGGFTFGKKGSIHINVPESGVNNIEMTSEDGNIAMSEISADHIVVESNAGDGKFEGVSADTGKFASKDGMISVEDSSIDELDITSTSGDNYMKNVNSSEAKVTSVDGVISIKEINEGKSLEVNTEAGDIEVSYRKAPTSLSVTAKSVSSHIALDIKGLKKSKDTENLKKGEVGQGTNELNLTSEDGQINVTD
ncbi:DUF4097 family beta strand repeat-containing protein [Terribacillus saccharophilus]|uniref:DUF4097 domain-containing protein n=1 Tax=Terribacillus saccharophilus TaxID=361277 RepID=A0ABX4GWV6_9BACI|nr:DUF4097 family beta strand repeat-containing protein [Terribacillus saccharophilus]PAD35079.1 hypothetical protein CHH56_11765 [Terribacillus saccharophilus]PAD95791.1 hypothetical protein CHH50_11995 [Terribacillus saccharophilus]PAD99359.1 hypothetical protein CHH48_12895 [Terribacillus saccharophilus]